MLKLRKKRELDIRENHTYFSKEELLQHAKDYYKIGDIVSYIDNDLDQVKEITETVTEDPMIYDIDSGSSFGITGAGLGNGCSLYEHSVGWSRIINEDEDE